MNAQVKLNEMWKSFNIKNYPIKTELLECQPDGINTSARSSGLLKEMKMSYRSQKTFTNDATHIWNLVPSSIKHCKSLYSAKKYIKAFVVPLPT